MSYKSLYGTGGLDVATSTGSWLGSFEGRGEIVKVLCDGVDEFLKWRDRWVAACRSLQGTGTETQHVSFYRDGRLVGGVSAKGSLEQVTALVAELWTEHAHAPYSFRFNLNECRTTNGPICRTTLDAIRDRVKVAG